MNINDVTKRRDTLRQFLLEYYKMSDINKRPSFMIRDILGAEGSRDSGVGSPVKSTIPSLPIPTSIPLPYFAYQPPPHGLPPIRHPAAMPYLMARGCYPVESFLEARDSSFPVPIPLPVYIRTRSPLGTDCFSKPKKCRRSRTVFTELQLMGLEKKFESHKYLSTPDRIELAETLALSQIQVKTWYQNRRMKWKKQVMMKGGTEPPTKPKGRPKKNSLETPDLSSSSGNSDIIVDSDEEILSENEEDVELEVGNPEQTVSSSSLEN